jgi:hypothetical protein
MLLSIMLSALIAASTPTQSGVAALGSNNLVAQIPGIHAVKPASVVIAPELCATAGAVHSVCGEVGFTGTLGAGGTFNLPVTIPTALDFPMVQYEVQLTSNWDVLAPPVTCIYTAQPVSPTTFNIAGTGCSFVPFTIGYTITGQ